jgi:uncharacterized protein YPO0396
MNITAWISGAGLLGVAAMYGLWQWAKADLDAKDLALKGAQATKALLENELEDAAAINQSALDAAARAAADLERQKGIAADHKKKSDDRLRENNLLRRNIQNVTDNPPVSKGLQLFLDSLSMRGSDAGPGKDSADESRDGGAADPDRPQVPADAVPAS